SGPARDGTRRAPRRPRRRAGDNDPHATAALDLLPRVVRSHRAGARARRRRRRRVHLPAQLRPPLPRPAGACRDDGSLRPARHQICAHRRRNHRDPRRRGRVNGAAERHAPRSTAEALDAVLRAGGPRLAVLLERTEERLVALASGHGAALAQHATATISAGGKRLRPLLVFLAAGPHVDGAAEARLVRAAVAVELIHRASLVHDDVLDAAAVRRGAPTVVAAAGRTMATATGDLLFSRAFAELADEGRGALEDVRALSAAATALAA